MNLKDAYLGVEAYFSPRIIGAINDQCCKTAKIKRQEISITKVRVPWFVSPRTISQV
jgi:hypothetical protein